MHTLPRFLIMTAALAFIGCRTSEPPADVVLLAIDSFVANAELDGSIDRSAPGWRLSMPSPPSVAFEDGATYLWNLYTSKGALQIRLFPGVAPKHVASTAYLTRAGYYDGLNFHRIHPGFMVQGGCPLGTGTGDPGYLYAGEVSDEVIHDRPGLVSMANADPDEDGSQFFITFAPAPSLDGVHTIFGEVVDSAETLAAIEKTAQTRAQMRETYSEAPLDPLTIYAATIRVE